jgi:hypothetical protein
MMEGSKSMILTVLVFILIISTPELIKSIDQNILTTNKLKELTNIQWHNTSPFDSVFDFASLISKPENKVVYLLELQVNPKQKKTNTIAW